MSDPNSQDPPVISYGEPSTPEARITQRSFHVDMDGWRNFWSLLLLPVIGIALIGALVIVFLFFVRK